MVSHGEFAPGLHSAVKMMTGDREDVLSTSLKDGMSADEFASNFAELIKDFKADDQVILLADILSGSPFTNALNVLDQKGLLQNTLVIAGMNMPLAITAVLMKDNFDNVQDLKDTLSMILPLSGLGTFQLLPANTPIVKTTGFCV